MRKKHINIGEHHIQQLLAERLMSQHLIILEDDFADILRKPVDQKALSHLQHQILQFIFRLTTKRL